MTPKFLPKNRKDRLARLMEESAEVLMCLAKIERFGLDTRFCKVREKVVKDENVESNREALLREMGDLTHAIMDLEIDLC